MPKCPHCGSAKCPDLIETVYEEDGGLINVVRRYICRDCKRSFVGYTTYVWDNMEEEFEEE